jgi:hypothetical protein
VISSDTVGLPAGKNTSASVAAKKPNLPLVDCRVGKYEFVQVLEHRELGPADAIADRAGLPVRALGPDQAGNERIDLITPCQAFSGNLVEACAHAVKLEFGHRLQDLMAFHHATFRMLS